MVHLAVVGVTTVIFGIASLLLISKARGRLSEGSIRRYMDNFAICLAFIVIFSVWQTARSIFGISINIEGLATYPEYIFIVFAYIAFVVASFRVMKISEEFGFKEDGRKIEQIVKETQKNQRFIENAKHFRGARKSEDFRHLGPRKSKRFSRESKIKKKSKK